MADVEEEYKSDYFRTPMLWLKWVGIPIKPLKMNIFMKLIYLVYCTAVLAAFPGAYVLGELIEATRLFSDLDRLTFNLGYSITHALGKQKEYIQAACLVKIFSLRFC